MAGRFCRPAILGYFLRFFFSNFRQAGKSNTIVIAITIACNARPSLVADPSGFGVDSGSGLTSGSASPSGSASIGSL